MSERNGGLTADLLFQGWAPRYELKAKAIIDHRKTARTQNEPPAVDTGDLFTLRRRPRHETGLSGNFAGRSTQFATSQGIKQIARKDHPLAPTLGEAFAAAY